MYDSQPGSNNMEFNEFHVTLANGGDLPDWVSLDPSGTLVAEAPGDVENLSLKIIGVKADGTAVARFVEVNTKTGAIDEMGAVSLGGKTFSQALSEAL